MKRAAIWLFGFTLSLAAWLLGSAALGVCLGLVMRGCAAVMSYK